MKFIAVILSIITLTLSAMPCDDEVSYGSEQLDSISQSSGHTNHKDIDLCTPFCSCVCCASVVLDPNIQESILISEIPTKELNILYVASFSTNYPSLVYQPPQV